MSLKQILEDFNLNRPTFNDIGTDKNTIHSYIEGFYEKEFASYQDKSISLLEIGVEFGASLKLWREYFKNAQTIIGIDIVDRIVPEYQNIDGVQVMFENAYDSNLVNSLPTFDIIIDDGSHNHEDHLKLLELYLPKLNPDGLLIIEDVQNNEYFKDATTDPDLKGPQRRNQPSWIGLKTKFNEVCVTNNLTNLSCEIVDLTNLKGRYDDLMFVVRAN